MDVVIGGGLAGLVTARELAAAGNEVLLFEAAEEVGGRVKSTTADGFIFNHGFQVLFPSYPAVTRALDLSALDLQYFRPGAMLVADGERSILSDPLRDPRALTATLFNRSIPFRDKLRIARLKRELKSMSPEELRSHDDQSIRGYCESLGFSTAFIEQFVEPFYGGITLDRSLNSSRYVFEYTFKMLATRSAAVPAAGMGAIPAQLADSAREAGVRITCDTAVEGLETTKNGVSIETDEETIEADRAVLATDPVTAQELTGIDSIPTAAHPCVTQYFSLPRRQQLNTDKRLVLNTRNDHPNHVAVMSEVAPTYAPDRTQLLSATFLGEQSKTDEELATAVRDELTAWFPENQFANLELLRTDRIAFAQLAQPPGFLADRPTQTAPDGPVVLAGDYTQWSSIQGAMESGYQAAKALQESE